MRPLSTFFFLLHTRLSFFAPLPSRLSPAYQRQSRGDKKTSGTTPMNAALRSTRASSALSASTWTRSTTMPPPSPTSEMRFSSQRAYCSRSSRFLCCAEEKNKVRAL